jgi:hypothetical protein
MSNPFPNGRDYKVFPNGREYKEFYRRRGYESFGNGSFTFELFILAKEIMPEVMEMEVLDWYNGLRYAKEFKSITCVYEEGGGATITMIRRSDAEKAEDEY